MPEHIRSDNGSEFVAQAIREWLKQIGVETLYIEPASPWENGYAESFHSRVRDEFMNCEIFENLRSARKQTDSWKEFYNEVRPPSRDTLLIPNYSHNNWYENGGPVKGAWKDHFWPVTVTRLLNLIY